MHFQATNPRELIDVVGDQNAAAGKSICGYEHVVRSYRLAASFKIGPQDTVMPVSIRSET